MTRLGITAAILTIALASDAAAERPARWRMLHTQNFRILHFDLHKAARIAKAAEANRTLLLSRWAGQDNPADWNPRCDIYLYPTNEDLVIMTGGKSKAGSARSVPSRLYRGRTLRRRVNLALDDRNLLTSTLPHEITHIILKDLVQKIPLWANEGIAVSSESIRQQWRYVVTLSRYLTAGPLYPLRTLMKMKRYPDGAYTHLYYAQASSLVRFLRKQSTDRNLLRFLRLAVHSGYETALRMVYSIESFDELQRQWRRFARVESRKALTPARRRGNLSRRGRGAGRRGSRR